MWRTETTAALLLAGGLLVGCALGGEERRPDHHARTDALPLWEIRNQGLLVGWLAGSVHTLPADAYPLPEPLNRAFESSGRLAVEVDLTALRAGELAVLTSRLGFYDDGSGLREHLPDATWETLDRYLDARGESLAGYRQMRPWLAALTLTNTALLELGHQPSFGIDLHYLQRAHAMGKPVTALETAEYQMRVFADAAPHVQARTLSVTLADLTAPQQLGARIAGLTGAWRRGDLAALHALTLDAHAADPELAPLLHSLLDARNEQMATRVHGLIEAGDRPMILVGALHLAGETGLIAALEGSYNIRQVYVD